MGGGADRRRSDRGVIRPTRPGRDRPARRGKRGDRDHADRCDARALGGQRCRKQVGEAADALPRERQRVAETAAEREHRQHGAVETRLGGEGSPRTHEQRFHRPDRRRVAPRQLFVASSFELPPHDHRALRSGEVADRRDDAPQALAVDRSLRGRRARVDEVVGQRVGGSAAAAEVHAAVAHDDEQPGPRRLRNLAVAHGGKPLDERILHGVLGRVAIAPQPVRGVADQRRPVAGGEQGEGRVITRRNARGESTIVRVAEAGVVHPLAETVCGARKLRSHGPAIRFSPWPRTPSSRSTSWPSAPA